MDLRVPNLFEDDLCRFWIIIGSIYLNRLESPETSGNCRFANLPVNLEMIQIKIVLHPWIAVKKLKIQYRISIPFVIIVNQIHLVHGSKSPMFHQCQTLVQGQLDFLVFSSSQMKIWLWETTNFHFSIPVPYNTQSTLSIMMYNWSFLSSTKYNEESYLTSSLWLKE